MNKDEKSLTYFVPNPTSGPPGLSTPEFRARYTVQHLSPEERDQADTACHALGCTLDEWTEANIAVMLERQVELREKLSAHERGELSLLRLNSYVAGLVADRIKATQAAKLPIIGERRPPDEDA